MSKSHQFIRDTSDGAPLDMCMICGLSYAEHETSRLKILPFKNANELSAEQREQKDAEFRGQVATILAEKKLTTAILVTQDEHGQVGMLYMGRNQGDPIVLCELAKATIISRMRGQ